MAEGLATSIAENLISKLTSMTISEIGLVYNCYEDLENLEDTLSIIKDVLLDADELQEKSFFVRNRIKKLEQVLYDADDLLDDVATENLRRNLDAKGKMARQVHDLFSCTNHVVFRSNMGHAIREIRDRLDQIASDISKFNFISNRVIVNTRFVGNRERDTDSFLSDAIVIGREKEKIEMIEMLLGSGSNTTDTTVYPIISIVGIGGLGKTTFAKLVFNDERVVKHFELRIWVCVSEDFKKEVIVRNILGENQKESNMEELQKTLKKKLDGKRYLLVLDDVWNEDRERWIQLERLLMVEANSSKIMVTTRSKKVAFAMGVDSPFLLNGLSDEQSLKLFEKLAFKEGLEKVLHHKLKKIGKELVTRCEGVPLAIKTLGSTMRSKTSVSEWESIQKNKIWSLSSGNSGILSVLKLSYDQLPTHLKYCFSYCSIFPKDHKIECEMLIQLWMAQGYIQSSEQFKNLEEIGIDYVRDFLSLSFFQEVEVDNYKNITSFKMHDLIHDLAIEVVRSNYYFIAENDGANNNVERVHHVTFQSRLGELPERLLREKGTRTFFLPDGWSACSHINVRQHRIMSNFKCLRVLDLHRCGIEKMRSSIGTLTHLRYLDLSKNMRLKGLPNSISNLLNLQTLKLSGCRSMKKLPGITKLINLRYLMIDGCYELKHMPSGINKLVLLQRLSKFVVGKDKNKWGGHSPCGRLSELKGLNNLGGKLRIDNLERVQVNDAAATNLMKEKEHLQSLELNWEYDRGVSVGNSGTDNITIELVLETLEPHPNLKKLEINGYCGVRFPSWMIKMGNVVNISLSECHRCELLQPLDQLPCLKFLSLKKLDSLEYIQEEEEEDYNKKKKQVRDGHPPPSSSSSSTTLLLLLLFPSLQQLNLWDLPKLKGWWKRRRESASEEEEEDKYTSSSLSVFPRLTKLTIERCPMFTSMPLHPNLEYLTLRNVSEKMVRERLTATTTSAEEEEEERKVDDFHHPHQMSSSSIISSKLKSLYIEKIQDLETLPSECLQKNLTSLHIKDCEKLKSISREVQHLTALENLSLRNCRELELSDDDDGMHWRCLRSLRTLEFEKIPKLVTPPVGIQHLFTTLQQLNIYECDGFLALPDWIGKLTQLQQLGFYRCPNFSSLPQEIRCLTSLRQLQIGDCPNFSSLPQPLRGLTSLQRLLIYDCPNFSSLPQEIGCLASLQELEIHSCPNFSSLPQEIGCLTSLQRLLIDSCPFSSLPQEIGCLTSLQYLQIYDCPNLSSLPQEIRCLTSLQQLHIRECPKLSERCQKGTGEDWLNIAHIPNLKIDGRMIQRT